MTNIPNNDTLLIKLNGTVFEHYRNGATGNNYDVISDFYWEIDSDLYFKRTKLAGAQLLAYQFQNVTVQIGSGSIETFGSRSALEARLMALRYPNQTAPVSGGVQSVTGTAVDNTDPANPVINTTGGGTLPQTDAFDYVSGAKTFTLSAGKTATQVFVETAYLKRSDWSQTGAIVTITSDLFGGEHIEIFNQ